MKVAIYETVRKMAQAAAELAVAELSQRIAESGLATFMAATGASRFAFLDALMRQHQVDWARTEMLHLDENVGLAESHSASFRRYLQDRLLDVVHPGRVHLVNGDVAYLIRPNLAQRPPRGATNEWKTSGRTESKAILGAGDEC